MNSDQTKPTEKAVPVPAVPGPVLNSLPENSTVQFRNDESDKHIEWEKEDSHTMEEQDNKSDLQSIEMDSSFGSGVLPAVITDSSMLNKRTIKLNQKEKSDYIFTMEEDEEKDAEQNDQKVSSFIISLIEFNKN